MKCPPRENNLAAVRDASRGLWSRRRRVHGSGASPNRFRPATTTSRTRAMTRSSRSTRTSRTASFVRTLNGQWNLVVDEPTARRISERSGRRPHPLHRARRRSSSSPEARPSCGPNARGRARARRLGRWVREGSVARRYQALSQDDRDAIARCAVSPIFSVSFRRASHDFRQRGTRTDSRGSSRRRNDACTRKHARRDALGVSSQRGALSKRHLPITALTYGDRSGRRAHQDARRRDRSTSLRGRRRGALARRGAHVRRVAQAQRARVLVHASRSDRMALRRHELLLRRRVDALASGVREAHAHHAEWISEYAHGESHHSSSCWARRGDPWLAVVAACSGSRAKPSKRYRSAFVAGTGLDRSIGVLFEIDASDAV